MYVSFNKNLIINCTRDARTRPVPEWEPMHVESTALESAIRRIGQELARRSAGLGPTIFEQRWWSNTLLDWCTKDEAFKVRLFRFIDVLPSLHDDTQVIKLVEEYFGDLPSLSAGLRWGLRAISATKLAERLTATSLRRSIHQM